MKRIMRKVALCLLVMATVQNNVKAQYVLNEADQQYALYNYSKAIDLYEKAYKKKATLHAAERLAASYKQQNDYSKAEHWYATVVSMKGSKAENILNYAQVLQNNAKYAEAKEQYIKYAELNTTITESQKRTWLLSCDSAVKWMKTPVEVLIKNEGDLNSGQSDWGATKYQGNTVFASDRGVSGTNRQSNSRPFLKFDGTKKPDQKKYGWTGNNYLRLYGQNGTELKLFPIEAGTAYHVGPASFTDDGKVMYFTLTKVHKDMAFKKVKDIKDKLATANLEIYSSTKDEEDKWSAPVAFKYNNIKEYSVGDPYITADGNRLYFVSDKPRGKGGTDIYFSEKNSVGDWESPVNLKEINTEGNERSPVLDEAGDFYFSSDGKVGMGGLDIYVSKSVNGKIEEPKNLGYPMNSPQDDFAFFKVTTETGYFSSNRTGGLGDDDIYSFTLVEPKKISYTDPVVLNKEIKIENIYYDFDKWNIRPDAAVELDKLVQVLEENPSIWIVLGSHTDSRGNDQYNLRLSQNRANSAVEYILKRGIDKVRITAKGYGESRLINDCGNGAVCSEVAHQLNRRTEFTIVKQ